MADAQMKVTKTVKFGKHSAEIVHLAFPAERFHSAFVTILSTQLVSGDFAKDTQPLIPFVESWSAPGDHKDVGAWSALDWVKEYGALRKAILDVVNDHLEDEGDIKN